MIKNSRIEEGKTPSVHSGRPSQMIKKGEAICEDEQTLEIPVPPELENENDTTLENGL